MMYIIVAYNRHTNVLHLEANSFLSVPMLTHIFDDHYLFLKMYRIIL